MRSKSTYLFAGAGFALGAVLFIISVLAQPKPPAVPPLAASDLLLWKATTLALFAGAALTLAGQIALSRHYAGSDADGWATLAIGAGVAGAIGYLGARSVEWSMYAAGVSNGVQPAVWGGVAMGAAGRIIAWGSVIAMSLALTRDRVLAHWLGFTGIVVGAVEIVAEIALPTGTATLQWLWIAGFVWLFALGVSLINARVELAAAAGAPTLVAAGN